MNTFTDRVRCYATKFSLLALITVICSCASTQKVAIPTAWEANINWENYNSAEVTPTEDLVIQNEADILIYDGMTGQVLFKDVPESKGLLGQFGDQMKKQVMGGVGSNDVEFKYWTLTLTESEKLLLFDRSHDDGGIRAIDLKTGEELWSSTLLSWNLEKYRDLAEGITDLASKLNIASGATAGLASDVLLQSRAISSMIKEIPGEDAFLFQTANGILNKIDAQTGRSLWQSNKVSSSGLASMSYLKDSNEFLVVGDMGGLKDIIKSADEAMKQVYRIDAESGDVLWSTQYKGRESQVEKIKKMRGKVLVYFLGGSMEFYDYESGDRLFGTRDDMAMGTTKLASAVSKTNTMETTETALPIVEGQAVYAINPTGDVNALALDDKQLVKYNYEMGEVIWKSPVLEKTMDVRNMMLTDQVVIVQVPGAGNVVGGSKESGMYAFDKETGELAWSFAEPLSKKYAVEPIYRDTELLTADGDLVYRINLEDGSVIEKRSFEALDLGAIISMKELAGDKLSIIGSKGLAIVSDKDFSMTFNTSVDGRVSYHHLNDDTMITTSQKLLSKKSRLYAFDLGMQNKITDFRLTDLDMQIYGNFVTQGYMPINDLQHLLTVTESGIVNYKL